MPWPGWRPRRAPGCSPPATSATTTPTAAASPTCSPPSGSRTTVDALGYAAEANAERHLKPPAEMARLFAGHPEALANSLAALEASGGFSLDQLRYEYPDEVLEPGRSPQETLADRVAAAQAARWPGGTPPDIAERIAHELRLIERAGLRALLPDRARDRPLRARPRHPLPGPRLGGQLGGLLRARHHRGRPGQARPAVRALRLGQPRRAARHRHRLRARAPRGGDPAPLRPLRPRAGGDLRHRHPLPHPQRRPRGRQGHGPLGGRHGTAGQGQLGPGPRDGAAGAGRGRGARHQPTRAWPWRWR